MKVKEESETVGLNPNIQKTITPSGPSTSWQIEGKKVETVKDFIFLSSKPTFSLSSLTFIKRLFSSSLSATRLVSSAFLKLLIFLLAILIPACASSSPVFLLMFFAYKLNKRVTIYSLDVLLFLFGTSLLFHVQF